MISSRHENSNLLERKNADLGVSKKSLAIARIIDRICRSPGHYQIILTVPSHRRDAWSVEFQRIEPIRKVELNR